MEHLPKATGHIRLSLRYLSGEKFKANFIKYA